MSDQDLPDILKREDSAHYQADTENYFKNLRDSKKQGPSADQLSTARPRLLTPEQEARYAERVERAADKTKRSGARVNSPSNVPGIIFDSMKNNSALIDEFTPGKMEAPTEMRPPDRQIAPTGWAPKPRCVVPKCIDCMKDMDKGSYVLGMTILTPEYAEIVPRLKEGDLIVYNVCVPCFDAAKELTRDKTPLVLVFGGELTDPKDIAIAQKYGFPINLHSGSEKTRGSWELIKRAERVMENLYHYIQSQPSDSPIFRNKETE